MQPTLLPYLNFNGNCAEAMEFYKSVLGGELEMQKFGDVPDMPVTEEQRGQVVHASLKNDAIFFMASDGTAEHKVTFGDSIHMSLIGTDEETLTKYFNDLSEGGTINTALEKQFWGDKFGMLTDKFGIHWMVNISPESHP